MNQIQEINKKYNERLNLFKSYGYDMDQERAFIIEKAQPVAGRILELGTGKGYFTVNLAQRGICFTSVDISKEEQDFAKMNLKYLGLDAQVNFVIDDAKSLQLADDSFDLVFAINILHHLCEPFKVIQEMIRVVAQGGRIILSDFNEEGFKLISQIHQGEGRHHPEGQYKIKDIENFELGENCHLEKYHTRFQDLIIIHNGRS